MFLYIYIYTYVHHHHHHIALLARVSLTCFRHSSLSFIASGRSSRLHRMSTQSFYRKVLVGQTTLTLPCEEVHHHHHVMPLARKSLTLSHHLSLSFIASGRSSGLHPVSSQSCCIYVQAGRPAFARPYVGVHRSTSLLLQLCSACLVRLTWILFVMGGRWPCSWCFVGCCRQDLFKKKK